MGVRDYTVLFVIPHVKKYNKKRQLISKVQKVRKLKIVKIV